MRSLLTALVLLAVAASSQPAWGSAQEAERARLEEEMHKLAARNTWKGVERTYGQLLALGLPLGPAVHLMASQAATSRGEVGAAFDRLEKAVAAAEPPAAESDPSWVQARDTLEAMRARYGRVSISVTPPRLNVLVSYQTPFVNQERECIENARMELIVSNTYSGLLPVGKYMVDGLTFEVEAHGEPVEVTVTP